MPITFETMMATPVALAVTKTDTKTCIKPAFAPHLILCGRATAFADPGSWRQFLRRSPCKASYCSKGTLIESHFQTKYSNHVFNFRKLLYKTLFFLARKFRGWAFRFPAFLEVFVVSGHIGKEKRSPSDHLKSQHEQSATLPSSSPDLLLQEIGSGKQSLQDGTERIQSWCSSNQVESDEDIKRLMVLSRDFAQEGFLIAGHELYQIALEAISRRAESIPTLAGPIIGAKAAIHLGDAPRAQHFTATLKRHFLLPNPHLYSIVAYVDIWSEGHTDVWSKGARDRSRSSSIVRNRPVQVINKGPIGEDFVPDPNALIARDVTPSSRDDVTPPSVGPNKTDIAYPNGETLAWLKAQSPSRSIEIISSYQSLAA